VTELAFGGMPHEEAELNMRLFAERVMPVLQHSSPLLPVLVLTVIHALRRLTPIYLARCRPCFFLCETFVSTVDAVKDVASRGAMGRIEVNSRRPRPRTSS
jgi:hypothetical protein